MIVTVTPNPALDRTLTVPHIQFDEMVRATASRLDWGGKGFNVSRALQSLGLESVATGFVGGATGETLERGLSDMGIATDFVHVREETRTNTVITEAATQRYVKVNEAGPMVRAQEVAAFLERARERVRPGDVWVLSGSLPPGAPSDFYAQLIRLVQAGDAKALLDTSGEPLRLGCAASPHLVKPNAVEAGEMMGRAIQSDADALDAAAFFLRALGADGAYGNAPYNRSRGGGQGIEMVALSLGADGLLLASQRRAVWARPPTVQARNPVGAGDALVAGITWALARGLPLDEVARWGVAAGTAAAVREGVSTGTRAEVETLYEQVRAVWAKLPQ